MGLTVAFTINGTRRWHRLEAPQKDYLDAVLEQHWRLIEMFFNNSVDTLIMPVFGTDLLERGPDYTHAALEVGLNRVTVDAAAAAFYQRLGVQVHFYGSYQHHLSPSLLDLLQRIAIQTKSYGQRRLFYGLFADTEWEAIARLAVEHAHWHNEPPSHATMIEAYYGEAIPPLDIFLGYEKPTVFDIPLLLGGETNLYWTVAPSPYLNEQHWLAILADCIQRGTPEPDYDSLTDSQWAATQTTCRRFQDDIIGLGSIHDGFWYPDLAVRGKQSGPEKS